VFACLDMLVQIGVLGSFEAVSAAKARLLSFVGLLVDAVAVLLVLFFM
jgi:hypothetical protein